MINVEITAKLIDLSNMDFKDVLDKVAKNLQLSIEKNFSQGGRPNQWAVIRKTGEPSYLHQTGVLFDTLDYGSDNSSAWAGIPEGRMTPYAWAHQMGYSPRRLPPRPYIMFQQEDIDFVKTELSGYIIDFFEVKGTAK